MLSANEKGARDDQLVKECLSGSEDAWTQFCGRFGRLILAVIRRHRSLVPESAEDDVLQAVYLKLLKSLQAYDHRQSRLNAFVSMIAKQTCIDHLRRNTAASRCAQTVPVDHHDGGEAGVVAVESRLDPPDQCLNRAQEIDVVSLAMSRLGTECVELLKLRYHLDLPYGEIAKRVGKKAHAVNVQTLRCLAQLRSLYDQLLEKGPRA